MTVRCLQKSADHTRFHNRLQEVISESTVLRQRLKVLEAHTAALQAQVRGEGLEPRDVPTLPLAEDTSQALPAPPRNTLGMQPSLRLLYHHIVFTIIGRIKDLSINWRVNLTTNVSR